MKIGTKDPVGFALGFFSRLIVGIRMTRIPISQLLHRGAYSDEASERKKRVLERGVNLNGLVVMGLSGHRRLAFHRELECNCPPKACEVY